MTTHADVNGMRWEDLTARRPLQHSLGVPSSTMIFRTTYDVPATNTFANQTLFTAWLCFRRQIFRSSRAAFYGEPWRWLR